LTNQDAAQGMLRQYSLSVDDARGLWSRKIEEIPSLFARIVYMAGLRNVTGRYKDPELAAIVGSSVCHDVIKAAHSKAFSVWFSLNWTARTTDLKPYLVTLGFRGSPARWPISWEQVCKDIVPCDASINDVQLFLGTVTAVIDMLSHVELNEPSRPKNCTQCIHLR
jgi:hypothetical protein